MASDIEPLLNSIRQRWTDLAGAPVYRESMRLHLQSLGTDATDCVSETENVNFPDRLSIAFAICKCGIREFIVDGSTQECQTCGSLMFRTEVADYELAPCK
jgi:hypothetical protein